MTPEAKVKSEVLEYLKATGRYYMRLQSGCVKVRGAFMHLCPVGTSDVLTFADDGGCIWIELKQLKGKQREAQIAFEHRMRAMGHRYVVVRCVEDVMRVFAKEAGK